MSNKPEIKDLLGLAEPATKLIEIVSGAIGTIYEPRKIKKLADAEAYRIQKLTTTAKETNFNGELEFLDGKIKISGDDINGQEIKSLVLNEVKRLFNENENIKRIADFAYTELESDKVEELAEDWYSDGTEVIFACAGAAGRSVMRAAEACGGNVIGADVDQSRESETVLVSAVKNIEAAVSDVLWEYYGDQEFAGGQSVLLDAENAGIGLSMESSRMKHFGKSL